MLALILSNDKTLNIHKTDLPVPKAGEVRIKLKAAALNHRDLWICKGLYPGMKLPCILGGDGAGVVDNIGLNVSSVESGDEVIIYPAYDWGNKEHAPQRSFRVLGMPDPGTFAEYIVVPETHIVKKPKSLTWQEAAALPIAGLTAWRGLVTHGKITEESKVLITGTGGGVAQLAQQIAIAFGAEVYITSSKEWKIKKAIELGAKNGVLYTDVNWTSQLKEKSGGIDIVFDSSPAENLDDYYAFLNYGAKVIAYGSTGNRKTTINISKFFLRHIQFIGTAMGSQNEFEAFINFVDKKNIKPIIDSNYKFADIKEAFESLSKGSQLGKITITY